MIVNLVVDPRIKTLDVGTPLIPTESKVDAVEHNS